MQMDSLENAAEHFNFVYNTYLSDTDCRVYFSVIPDKNHFMAAQNGYPGYDYTDLVSSITSQLPQMQYIEISDLLSLDDYYRTDTHWRQEKIIDVAKYIASQMGVTLSADYAVMKLEKPFYGVYYGQASLPMAPDTLYYLQNDLLQHCTVYDYETSQNGGIYDMNLAQGNDPYELFLSGSKSLLIIENPNAESDRELIVFRDSFGSSLTPLLVEGYRRVTVVDIRYLSSHMLGKLIDFNGQDVLFLYSTLVLNNSITLK